MKPGRESAVLITDGWHVEDLSIDQLDTLLLGPKLDLTGLFED